MRGAVLMNGRVRDREHAPWAQRLEHTAIQRALVVTRRDVMERQRRYDRVALRQHVRERAAYRRGACAEPRDTRGGQLEHVRIDVDEVHVRVWHALEDCTAERAGAGAKIDNEWGSQRPDDRDDRIQHRVVCRNPTTDQGVVVGDVEAEMSAYAVAPPLRFLLHSQMFTPRASPLSYQRSSRR